MKTWLVWAFKVYAVGVVVLMVRIGIGLWTYRQRSADYVSTAWRKQDLRNRGEDSRPE